MLILSWNVAGLSQTLRRIDSDYPASSSTGPTSAPTKKTGRGRVPRSQSFANYLARHSADIFCVQEAKIPLTQLKSRSEPLSLSTVPGYESFWSTNNSASTSKRGFNGVATYARIGTVRSADPCPLGSAELDDQGRCIMTDHGSFVLFNVYAPAGGSNPLSFKMKFLNALRNAMRKQREEFGRRVVLVGDLNIAHKAEDVHWKYRFVHVDRVLDEVKGRAVEAGTASEPLPRWKVDLADNWAKIKAALETKEAIPTTTKNVTTGATFDKFRVRVTAENGRQVILGRAETTKEEALWYYDFSLSTYFDDDLGVDRVAREANCVSLEVLIELMAKIARVEWDAGTQSLIASTDADVKHASPTIEFMSNLVEEDRMVDTFRHFYPTAKGRFTCWHQYTNKRFENEGCRIDYMLVDAPLLPYVQKGSVSTLRCCNYPHDDPNGEEAALHAATASGTFQGASFGGNGIAVASQEALDTQFGPAHTGIVYTPPSYSDHIATSLLFDESVGVIDPPLVLNEGDPLTKKAQPHKSQPSIASFFGRNTSSGVDSAESSSRSTRSVDCDKVGRATSDDAKKRKGQQSIASSFKRAKDSSATQTASKTKTVPKAKPKNGKSSILSHFSKCPYSK